MLKTNRSFTLYLLKVLTAFWGAVHFHSYYSIFEVNLESTFLSRWLTKCSKWYIFLFQESALVPKERFAIDFWNFSPETNLTFYFQKKACLPLLDCWCVSIYKIFCVSFACLKYIVWHFFHLSQYFLLF